MSSMVVVMSFTNWYCYDQKLCFYNAFKTLIVFKLFLKGFRSLLTQLKGPVSQVGRGRSIRGDKEMGECERNRSREKGVGM